MTKILLVDSSDTRRLKFSRILRIAGHKLVELRTVARDDLADLAKAGIELVVADSDSGQDALVISRAIRQVAGLEDVPMFLLINSIMPNDKEAGRAAGGLYWIIKPFDYDGVVACIAKAVSRHQKVCG